ncbi:MAG: Ig-like domain-containing protein, partial [Acidimicrobiia bacterium]
TAAIGSDDIDPEPANNLSQLIFGTTNSAPDAVDDSDSTAEDTAVTVDVLGNDSDTDLDPLSVSVVTQGLNGSVVNNGTSVTYDPDPDWNGMDTFTYTVSDGNGGFATGTVTVTVTPANDDPQGQPDAASTPEETAVEIEVLANDSDVDSSALTVTAVAGGTHGTVSTDGITLTYTPDLNWNGIDTFTYRVSDDLGGWCEAIVTVTVTPVNDDPVAVDDLSTTPRDTPVNIWVLDNDTDADPDTLSVSGFTNGAHGTVVNRSIKVTYTPAAGWTGVDTFTYTVSDGNGGFDSGTVTVTVTAVPNQPPAANDDSMVTDEDVALTIPVLANDSDPDGDAITVSAVNEGAHGAVTKTATSITYTPDGDWSGIDSFSYSITDGHGGWATAAVVITVKPVNDPPLARDDYKGTPQATAVSVPVLVNDFDVDGDPLAVAGVSPGSHGVTTTDGRRVTYSPDPGWTGTDFFTYTVTDGHGGSDNATVAIAVGIANRPPTITVKGDTSVREDEPLALEVSVWDPDGDDVSITTSGLPGWASTVDHGNGTTTISGIPGFDADPSNEIIISVSDGTVTTRTTVLIEVKDVNRPPLIGPITFSGVHEDGSFSFTISASDADGDLLAISTNGLPSWATLTDYGDGRATISSPGVPHDALGSFSVVVSVTDGQTTVTSRVERLISDLRNGLPPELTHQAFDIAGVDTLVSTSLTPRVATPNSLNLHLTPREGLMVAFGSAVESLKSQILPALALGVVMAWMLMIGVGRTKEEEDPETA